MKNFDRRHLMKTAIGAGATVAATQWLGSPAAAEESPKRRIKIGQIGTGHGHACETMSCLRKLTDQYEVVGVVEPDPKLRKKYEKSKYYRDLPWMTEEELFAVEGLEAVALELNSADQQTLPTLERCIDAGLHVHLDKPAGESYAKFKASVEKAKKKNLVIQLGYIYRTNSAVQFCQNAVRKGWLGEVFEIHGVMSRMHPIEYRRDYLAKFRGGTIFIFAGYLIDFTVNMMGTPDKITSFMRQTRSDVGLEMCDNGLIVLEYPKATATLRTASNEVQGFDRRQLIVCGDHGTIEICPIEKFDIKGRANEPLSLRLTLDQDRDGFKKGHQEVTFSPMPYSQRHDGQLIELAQVIRGDIENPYSLDHELTVQKCLLEACGYPTE